MCIPNIRHCTIMYSWGQNIYARKSPCHVIRIKMYNRKVIFRDSMSKTLNINGVLASDLSSWVDHLWTICEPHFIFGVNYSNKSLRLLCHEVILTFLGEQLIWKTLFLIEATWYDVYSCWNCNSAKKPPMRFRLFWNPPPINVVDSFIF